MPRSTLSRPSKNALPPPPLYLASTPESPVDYCETCGRVISSRKRGSEKQSATDARVKYCSHRCRRYKVGPVDKQIEQVFVRLLDGEDPGTILAGIGRPNANVPAQSIGGKGDSIISCDYVEHLFFRRLEEGRKRPRRETDADGSNRNSCDAADPQSTEGPARESPQSQQQKQIAGQRCAEEREMVRRAARRGCVFGFVSDPEETNHADAESQRHSSRGMCEAIQGGKLVEPSFAKGDWGIRWRDDGSSKIPVG